MAALEPPGSEQELYTRAQGLAGATLGELAAQLGQRAPADLRRAKGFTGHLVEQLLGAAASSRAEPDFPALGVELKTLPVGPSGRPVESTFVCTIDLSAMDRFSYEDCWLRRKLARVLWIPVEGSREIPVPARRLGAPLLWSPSSEEEAVLRADWEELAGLIARGGAELLHGRLGRALQVRPKAAGSWSRRRALDGDGVSYLALPRGFYLRASFTAQLVCRSYALPTR